MRASLCGDNLVRLSFLDDAAARQRHQTRGGAHPTQPEPEPSAHLAIPPNGERR